MTWCDNYRCQRSRHRFTLLEKKRGGKASVAARRKLKQERVSRNVLAAGPAGTSS
jgi:hypothetical protein